MSDTATADLELIRDASEQAGRIALKYWNEGAEAWEKPGGEGPVTEADLAVDNYLCETLTKARPDYGWLSEESQDDPARLSCRRVFIVDPIDGTRSFANGERTWAVSVAVVEDGSPIAAAVVLPARDKVYSAALGHGAHLGTTRLRSSTRGEVAGATVLAARPTMAAPHWPGGVPPVKREFRSSLAYRMAVIGEGRFDAMVTFRDTWEWDIAAGALIAIEAGATVTDRNGQALRLNSPDRHTKGIIAGGPEVHAGLLRHRQS
ncbi:MAG: 3'(2'),5'-bisphosphate nucleotidase CysQ [Pseudomonadota bacterium]